jgi:hypothetical protein
MRHLARRALLVVALLIMRNSIQQHFSPSVVASPTG